MKYNHNLVEQKWLASWDANKLYNFVNQPDKPKFYVLDMFPYPSGKGLHVGHVKGYTATDIISRYKNACGFNVIHPIGFDAFGLPAEQFAIKTNEHPATFTQQNVDNFKRQLKMMGFNYSPNLEINTTDPKYYKWTQWIFNQLYKHGLAEIADMDVNWCEALGTVLANEEVLLDEHGNRVSERGSYPVVTKKMRQWVLKITKYADKLLQGLDEINWTDSIKKMQRNWIGKSTGALIDFKVENQDVKLTVFTTRPDTIFGVSFLAIAHDHDLIDKLVSDQQKPLVEQYIKTYETNANNKSEQANTKLGVFTGSYVINPVTKKPIPVWIGNHVLRNYGTGVVMATPAHDLRDYEFAKKYDLPIVNVIEHQGELSSAYCGDGKHINSDFLNGLNIEQANQKVIAYLEEKNLGKQATVYKLRDWIFSRQRYWGEPFPVLFDESNQVFLVEDLPVVLPEMTSFAPNPDGLPPLANATKWTNVIIDDKLYHRETNTMPQWAGSCWYYLAYLMKIGAPENEYWPIDSNEAKAMFARFLPVDIYVGGQEHAVLHLLYARFWHRFLYDINVVPTPEPFMQLINQGMILNADGTKMSKSKGTLINPDDICNSHGADTLRLYEMFMGPITASLGWSDERLDGSRKWLERVWALFHKIKIVNDDESDNQELVFAYHTFVKKATQYLDHQEFNLLISEMMIFINACYKVEAVPKAYLEGFVTILGFVCPFIAEELNEFIGNSSSIVYNKMPVANQNLLVVNQMSISCMVNGKFKASAEFDLQATQEEIQTYFLNQPKVQALVENKPLKKVIYIKGKAISFIV